MTDLLLLQTRLFDRTPLLGAGRRKQAALAAGALEDADAALLLANALVGSNDEVVLGIATERLERLNDAGGIDAVCAVWARTRHPRLHTLIVKHDWIASGPPEVRVRNLLAVRGADALIAATPDMVPALVEATEDADPTLSEAAWDALARLVRPDAKEALCDMVIDQADPRAARAVRDGGYQPAGLTRAALLLLLSGQDDAYTRVDPQGTLLLSWLRTAGTERRTELATRARDARLLPWALALLNRPVEELTSPEWDALLIVLAEHHRLPAIWRLATLAPTVTSVAYMRFLLAAGFAPPPDAPEVGLFAKLAALAPRCIGDPAAMSLRVRERLIYEGKPGSATCVALSPDWRYVAVGGDDTAVRLVSLPDGTPGPILDGLPGWTRALSFGASGRYLAIATMKHQTRIYRLPDGLPVAYLDTRDVVTVALRTDGRLLASAAGQRIDLWDVEAGTIVRSLPAHGRMVKGLTIGTRGCTLASWGADGAVRVWSLPDGQPIGTIAGDETGISAVTLSHDESRLAVAGGDHKVRVYTLPTGEMLAELPGDEQPVRCLSFRPDGEVLAVGAHSHRVRLFRVADGEPLGVAEGYAGAHHLAWNGMGQLLAAAVEGKRAVRIWLPGAPPIADDTVQTARPEEIGFAQRLHKDPQLSREEHAWLTYWGTLVLAARGALPAESQASLPVPTATPPA